MPTFLHLGLGLGVEVLAYDDEAVGVMSRNEDGHNWIGETTLHPVITYGKMSATRESELEFHAQASAQCFIGLSIKTRAKIVSPNTDQQNVTKT